MGEREEWEEWIKGVALCCEEGRNDSLSTTTNMADAYTVSELLTVGRLMPHGPLPRFGEDIDFAVWSMRHVIGAVSALAARLNGADDVAVV
jgi:hypothetical protein